MTAAPRGAPLALPRRARELPPTAGLPLTWRDLWAGAGDLEGAIGAQLGIPRPILTCSGSAALIVALRALAERAPGRNRVVIPAYTCPLVALAVQQAGLVPVACDTAPGSFNFDLAALQRLCDARTLALVPTHLGGRVADVATAVALARSAGAFVIEDAAQALGAQAGGRSVGLAGDVGFFSLAVGKGLTTYEGGLLFAADAQLQADLRQAAARWLPTSRSWEWRRSAELIGYAALYGPRGLRWAYGRPLRRALQRGDPVAAVGDDFALPLPQHRMGRWRRAVGAHAAARLPQFLADTRAQATRHLAQLQALPGVRVLEDPARAAGTWPFFLLLAADGARRDAALARLWASGYGVSRLFIHALPDYAYLRQIEAPAGAVQARDFAARSFSIGNSLWLQDADMEQICAVLRATCA